MLTAKCPQFTPYPYSFLSLVNQGPLLPAVLGMATSKKHMATINTNIHVQVCTLCLLASRGFLSAPNLLKLMLLELNIFHA